MPDSSIVVFADGGNQHFYWLLKLPGETLGIFDCAEGPGLTNLLKAEIILIDCGFKTKMGLELLSEIKRVNPQTPVVFLTDSSSEELAISAFRTGAREYIPKPVNLIMLRETVKNLLQMKRTSREIRISPSFSGNNASALSHYLKNENLPVRILDALAYIEDNFIEEISLAELAEAVKMSKCYFSRYFKEHMGVTPMKHLKSFRILKAKKLLSRGDLTVKEIAHLTGFDDLNKFVRNFKQENGLTPKEYRKKLKVPKNTQKFKK